MYNKTILPNGVRIISEDIPYFKSVSVGIWVASGSQDELKATNGVSHFIEHMLFKGTHKRNGFQIAKEFDAIGGMWNAFTGKDETCFYARVLGKHLPIAAEILSDIFLNPLFDKDDIEVERNVILQEIYMTEDTPDDIIHDIFYSTLWSDHSLGMPISGTKETVAAIDTQTMQEYIRNYYISPRIAVVAAGDVKHDQLLDLFSPLFEKLSYHDDYPPIASPPKIKNILIKEKDLEQVHFCLGGNAPEQGSEDRFACAVLNTIWGGNMSSRLFQIIRERYGLSYSVFSFLSSHRNAGVVGMYAASEPESIKLTLELSMTEMDSLLNGNIKEDEVSAARDYLTGSYQLSYESVENRMMELAKNEFIFGRKIPMDEILNNINRITFDQVVDMASRLFVQKNRSLAVLGPVKDHMLF